MIVVSHPVYHYCWQLTDVSISAQFLTFPLILFYFHQFPVYFWLSSIFAIFFAQFILVGCLLLFLLHPLSSVLSDFLATTISSLTKYFYLSIEHISNLPFHIFDTVWISPVEVFFIYLALISLMSFLIHGRYVFFLAFLLFILVHALIHARQLLMNQYQTEIISYHAKYKFYDVFIGDTAYELASPMLSESAKKNIAQNNRDAHGIHEVVPFVTLGIYKQ